MIGPMCRNRPGANARMSSENASVFAPPYNARLNRELTSSEPSFDRIIEVAPKAVAIADRDDSDPRRPLREEAPAVADARPGLQPLDLRQVGPPRERGLEPIGGRVLAER